MKRILLFAVFFLALSLGLTAQDTLTVMQYNLLEYGNHNSGFAECYETNNNTQRKDECIRLLMDCVKPDILTVCEFGSTQALQSDFLRHNLNINGADYWKTDNIVNYAGSNIINHIFYDSRKMELKKHVALRTNPRDTDIYELYLKTSGLLSGDTITLVCIVAHPKAGMGYEASRRATMQAAMDYVSLHYENDNVLIMGDFNMYRASETGYKLLTQTYSNVNARFVDPLANEGGVGEWSGDAQFARFHTQSTRRYSEECFSGGGLDDRFDFILMSDEILMDFNHIKYINGSFHAVGNDGWHFDKSINQGGNAAVPYDVAEALYDASDHLPVTMQMKVNTKLGVADEVLERGFQLFPNPTNGAIHIKMNLAESKTYRIVNMMGQTVMTGQVSETIEVSGLPAGMYFIQIDGMIRKFVKD